MVRFKNSNTFTYWKSTVLQAMSKAVSPKKFQLKSHTSQDLLFMYRHLWVRTLCVDPQPWRVNYSETPSTLRLNPYLFQWTREKEFNSSKQSGKSVNKFTKCVSPKCFVGMQIMLQQYNKILYMEGILACSALPWSSTPTAIFETPWFSPEL